jgi:tetratricopeptide (TPR) repeat protein
MKEFKIEPFETLDRIRAKNAFSDSDVALLRGLTETHPNEPELWDFLGDLMQVCESHYPIEASIDCYRRAIACDGMYAPAYESMGWALGTYFNQLEESSRNFLLALEFGAGDSSLVGLARIRAETGEIDEAIQLLHQCQDQSNPDVMNLRREIGKGFDGDSDMPNLQPTQGRLSDKLLPYTYGCLIPWEYGRLLPKSRFPTFPH